MNRHQNYANRTSSRYRGGSGLQRNTKSTQRTTRYSQRTTAYPSRNQFPFRLGAVVLGVLVLAILITLGIQSCSEKTYYWDNLQNDNGRYVYVENGSVTSLTGIDVSSHQQEVNWQAVAEDGIDFAMLRCGRRGSTEGQIYADETFYTNSDGAQAAGIPFGVYFYSQATNTDEAREEAQYVLDMIRGMQVDGPIAYDFELQTDVTSRADGLTAEEISTNAEAFCSVIEAAGYSVLIYGNQHDLERYDLNTLHHDIWYAEYSSSYPSVNDNVVMWQYTATGSVSGISTSVDLNVLFDTSLVSS